MFRFSSNSESRLLGVNDNLIAVTRTALSISPIDFGIAWMGGYRTPEEQNKLFLAGSTNCDGYDKLSNHQSGNAIDTYAWVNGRVSHSMEHLAIIAAAHLQAGHEIGVPMGWGGLWKSIVDGPHLYILD